MTFRTPRSILNCSYSYLIRTSGGRGGFTTPPISRPMLDGLILIKGNTNGRNVHLHEKARIRVASTGIANGNGPLTMRDTRARGTLLRGMSELDKITVSKALSDGRNVCAGSGFITSKGASGTALGCRSLRSVTGRYD